MLNYGMKVRIRFQVNSIYQGRESVLRNVTEIHYNCNMPLGMNDMRIVFESDLHGTGIVYNVSDILEFESLTESEIAEEF